MSANVEIRTQGPGLIGGGEAGDLIRRQFGAYQIVHPVTLRHHGDFADVKGAIVRQSGY
jgi:hypothetical protein